MKNHFLSALLAGLLQATLAIQVIAAEGNPPASPEVTAAMQPYLDSYKLAGVVSLIADKTGMVNDTAASLSATSPSLNPGNPCTGMSIAPVQASADRSSSTRMASSVPGRVIAPAQYPAAVEDDCAFAVVRQNRAGNQLRNRRKDFITTG